MESRATGTYVLALWLDRRQRLRIGSLGEIDFPFGWYLYVGGALGPGGLRARLARHRRRLGGNKRLHWHVDYLRESGTWGGSWARATGERLECAWASTVRHLPEVTVVVKGFGASDCRCPAHLVRVPDLPDDAWFASTLGAERIAMEDEELARYLQVPASGDEESREAAALALGRSGPEAIEPLTGLIAVDDPDIRWWAARGLAEVGGDGVVQPLTSVLSDPDPDVRACAALALGRIGAARAAPALAERLADESAFVASIAADALTMIGEPAVGSLVPMLAAESAHTRLQAVRALGRIRSQSAIGPLFGALEDDSYLVRYYAQEILDSLGVGMVYFSP